MSFRFRALTIACAAAAVPMAASAQSTTTLTFDDLPSNQNVFNSGPVGINGIYMGVDFSNQWFLSTKGAGSPYSAPNYIRPAGLPQNVQEYSFRLLQPGKYDGAFLQGTQGASFQLNYYYNGQLVHQDPYAYFSQSFVPAFFASNYSGAVDTIGFFGRSGFALDNLQISTLANSIPSGAPEPASWMMMLTGFGLAGGTLRHRKKLLTPA